MEEKYTLVGCDGNAFSVMGYVTNCMRRERFTAKDIQDYVDEAIKSDYNHLLCVSCDYIDKCNERYFARKS